MQSKVIFFSESNIKGKVPRDFENARTEFGWSIMLDAEWCPLNDIPKVLDYDLGIVIIPKTKIIIKDERWSFFPTAKSKTSTSKKIT